MYSLEQEKLESEAEETVLGITLVRPQCSLGAQLAQCSPEWERGYSLSPTTCSSSEVRIQTKAFLGLVRLTAL